MSKRSAADSLFDPRKGDEPLRVEAVRFPTGATEPRRTNYFSIYRIRSGRGEFWADAARHSFAPNSLLFFVPYQHIRFEAKRPVQADRILFHANFLCVETFHSEVGCAGILFNDPYGVPKVEIAGEQLPHIEQTIAHLHREQTERGLAHEEASLAYLKVLLILATRLKSPGGSECRTGAFDARHPVLGPLRELVEQHYASLHSPADYARLLHMTPKTLGRIVREQLGKTLTDLIRERILTRAKWELLHTLKPVKQVAREVGFADELYFSRMFKKATGVSPLFFRQFETEIRGGSNLSMVSAHAPIQPGAGLSDTSSSQPRRAARSAGR
jgi:AraC family transcriptional activator of pobA